MARPRSKMLSAFVLAVAFAAPADAKPFTYVNARFGTTVTFPDEVFPSHAEEPANGDGLTFLAPDGASLAIYGSNNVLDQTPDQLAEENSEGRQISYRKIGKDWVVLSGHDRDGIFYQHLELGRHGVIHAFLLQYPASAKAKYDPLVGSISRSLNGP